MQLATRTLSKLINAGVVCQVINPKSKAQNTQYKRLQTGDLRMNLVMDTSN